MQENFVGYFFKHLFAEILGLLPILAGTVTLDDVVENLGHYIYLKGITWFIHPMRRISLTRLIHVDLWGFNMPEAGQIDAENNPALAQTNQLAPPISPRCIPQLPQPIALKDCADMKRAFELVIPRLLRKFQNQNQNIVAEYRECLEEATAVFKPLTDAMDLFALLAFWLCLKNRMKRSTDNIGNDSQAGALLLHYILLKGPRTRQTKDFLRHFGGDQGLAFQNYGAGKKFLKKIGFLVSNTSQYLNVNHLRSFTVERILDATTKTLPEQIEFFGLKPVVADQAE